MRINVDFIRLSSLYLLAYSSLREKNLRKVVAVDEKLPAYPNSCSQISFSCPSDEVINQIQIWDVEGNLLLRKENIKKYSFCYDEKECYSVYIDGGSCDDLKMSLLKSGNNDNDASPSPSFDASISNSIMRIGNCTPPCTNMDEIFLFVKTPSNIMHEPTNNNEMNYNNTTLYRYLLYNESNLIDEGTFSMQRAKRICKEVNSCHKIVADDASSYYSLLRNGHWMETSRAKFKSFGYCKPMCDNSPDLFSTQRGKALMWLATTISGTESLFNRISYAYKATCWLVYDDLLKIEKDSSKFFQRYFIASFYFATNGANWFRDYSFLSPLSECLWKDENGFGITCDQEDNVISISLSHNGLTGTINTEIFRLRTLESLSLSNNQLKGTLSTHIALLFNLKMLDLSKNQYNGSIPAELSQLQHLQAIDLSQNFFSSIIPPFSASIEYLHLSKNKLSGNLPDFGLMTQLRSISLENNMLNCTLSAQFSSSLTKLQVLNLRDNNCHSNLPLNFFTSLSSLSHLELSQNFFTNQIPDQFNDFSNLTEINLSHNLFQGSIPMAIFILPNLASLDLSDNQLTSILSSFVNVSDTIENLRLHDNLISAELSFDNCKQFSTLTADCASSFNDMSCSCCTLCYDNAKKIFESKDYIHIDDDIAESISVTDSTKQEEADSNKGIFLPPSKGISRFLFVLSGIYIIVFVVRFQAN